MCADLHIHTCLSPCAEEEMSPSAVVRWARERGIDIIAICDHNTAENVEAARRAAQETELAVIGGMELTSREEVHLLGLFDRSEDLASVQRIIYENLAGENEPEVFGEQLVMDENDRVVSHNRRLLIGATELTLAALVRLIHDYRGLAIASHIDRPSFSVLSQLGFIPQNLKLDAVEIHSTRPSDVPEHLSVIRSSDAHRRDEVGSRCTRFLIEDGTVSEIARALSQTDKRRIVSE